ncbi:MAG: hypothetical protein KDB14_18880 [Planctomycetales bacterium]|nr:hypothetical protein [Planctomycetales bacterium]
MTNHPTTQLAGWPSRAIGMLAMALIATAAWNGPARGAEPSEEEQARALVKQLGDDVYVNRQLAAAKLQELGLAAAKALEEGASSVDREIRYSCQRLLSEVRARQLNEMLDRFLQGREDEYPLPAWSRYKERIGDSRASRQLFVEMYRAEPDLLKAMEQNPAQASAAIYPRARQVQEFSSRGAQLGLGDVAALVFVGSDPEVEVNSQTYSYVTSLLHQPIVHKTMSGGVNKPLLAKMMGQWVLRGDSNLAYQSLLLAMQYQLPEGIQAAENTLKQSSPAPHVKQYAILTIAKLGDKRHISILTELLEDSSPLQTRTINNVRSITQVRDVALAAAVHLAGRPLRDVGFQADVMPDQQPFVINPSQLGFKDEKERKVVFDKWETLKKELKLDQ